MHRTGDLGSRDIQRVDGVPCTNAIRTCIDLGACLSPEQLEAVIERARNDRLVHLDPLIARFLQLARRGRDGIATTRLVLQRIDPALEPAESDLETLLLRVLRERHVPSPVRQHEVRIEGRRFRLNLCYPPQRLAIESDGFATHGTRIAFEDDRSRQNLLVLDGWRILRFTWRQVCTDPDFVAEQVRAALELAS